DDAAEASFRRHTLNRCNGSNAFAQQRDGLAMEHALLSRPEAVVDEFAGHENDASRGLEGSSSQSSNDFIHYVETSVTRSVGRQFGRPCLRHTARNRTTPL